MNCPECKAVFGPDGLEKPGIVTQLRLALAAAQHKLDYVHKMGIRFGMMSSSDKPEPYLAHTWDENSDHERMFREWSDSIGWEEQLAKSKARFPMIDGPQINEETALDIYRMYCCLHSNGQTLERIRERGGFGWSEVALIWKQHEYLKLKKLCSCKSEQPPAAPSTGN